MSLVITNCISITFEDVNWTTKLQRLILDDGTKVETLSLRSCYGLIRLLVAMSGITPPSQFYKQKPKPTLSNVPGYTALIQRRNQAQAAELWPAPAPKRKLFADAPSPKKKQPKRRSMDQIQDLRSNPAMLNVSVVEGDADSMVCFKRPVMNKDEMVSDGITRSG